MKSKRIIAALLAMMLSVTAMTACGGSDSSNGTSSVNSSTVQNADGSDPKNEQTGDIDMEGLTAINDSTAKRVGRTYIGDDNTLWLALSGKTRQRRQQCKGSGICERRKNF